MTDDRESLKIGTGLFLGKIEYIIQEEMGRGASCICYGASYLDSAGLPHNVRIKEFYPYGMGIARNGQGALQVTPDAKPLFQVSQEKFQEAYQSHVALKRTMGIINSTVDAMDIFHRGNTSYVVMGCIEGMDYRKETDANAQAVFIRMAALAKIIQKYHSQGILHLDIKPENILVIPETMEHLLLFDFDSLAPSGALEDWDGVDSTLFFASQALSFETQAGKGHFSRSDGFAAPELCQQETGKIRPATDIYSIGAIVFYKLFGRTPQACDGAVGASYDFASMYYQDAKYPPEFFSKLTTFFHKSIASAAGRRYQDVGELLEALQELAELSDVGRVFLCPNFSYHFEGFIGRERELSEIYGKLSKGQVLFLSGIGGIGKTEAAKRFAYEYQEEFRNVLFVTFQDSLLKTVCSDEIQIHNFARDSGESDQEFFARKLGVLKQVASQEDLLILDNFDTEGDAHLEQLLSCPCKFLITSREDFKDYRYAQVTVSAMEKEGQLEALFRVYNQKAYGEEEQAAVRDILRLVEGHTMTVELIAKYLRDMGTAPSQFLAKIMEKEGIATVEEIPVKHRKDRKLQAESVSRHLQALFDLSGFTSGERELLQSLSLLGPIRIRRETFLELCMGEMEKDLARLIRRGFIQCQEEEGKLSLHQVILDMAYCKLQPDSRQCPHIVDGMKAYMQKECGSRTEAEIRDRLLGIFAERLKGDDLRYASFLTGYCGRFFRRGCVPEFLDRAEAICKISSEKEAKGCLEKVYSLKANRKFLYIEENTEEFDTPESLADIAGEAVKLMQASYQFAREFSDDAGYLGKRCVEYGKDLERIVNQVEIYADFWEEDGRVRGFDLLLSCAAEFYQEAEPYLLESDLPAEEKIRMIEQIQEFYGNEDFTALYRLAFFADAQKAYDCQQVMDRLLRESRGEGVAVMHGVSAYDMAREALEEGDYEKAVFYFNKEIEEGVYYWRDEGDAYFDLGEAYRKMGDRKKAAEIWEELLERQEGEEAFDSFTCEHLVSILISDGKKEAARKYALEFTEYHLGRYKEKQEEDSFHLPHVIEGEFWLYQLEEDSTEKAKRWEACLSYYKRLPKGKLPEEILDFLEEYLGKIQDKEEKLAEAFRLIRESSKGSEWEKGCVRVLAYIVRNCKKQWENAFYAEETGKGKAAYQYCKALAAYSRSLVWEDLRQKGQALPYAMEADRIYRSQGLSDEYLYSLIHCALSQCTEDLEEYQKERAKCNYFRLAQQEVQGMLPEQALEIWEEAASNLADTGRWELQERCYQKISELYASSVDRFQDDRAFWNYWKVFSRRLSYFEGAGQREECQKAVLCMYRDLVCYLFQGEMGTECAKREPDKDLREKFCESLEGLASQLARIGCPAKAASMYALVILAAAGDSLERDVFDGIESYFAGDLDRLLDCFSSALQGSLFAWQVDSVFFYWENMRQEVGGAECFLPFDTAFQWFREEYREKEVSFKR